MLPLTVSLTRTLCINQSVDGLAFSTFFARAATADVADSVLLLKVRALQRDGPPSPRAESAAHSPPRGTGSACAGAAAAAAETSIIGCFSSGRWRDRGSRSFGSGDTFLFRCSPSLGVATRSAATLALLRRALLRRGADDTATARLARCIVEVSCFNLPLHFVRIRLTI